MIDDPSGNIRAYLQQAAETELQAAQYKIEMQQELVRPFMLLRPRIFPDENQWCALLGENLQMGVCGFGDTPAKASFDFDLQWLNGKAGVKP